MGAEQSVLSQALADLRRIEDGARKAAKKGKKDGASMCFEDGVWQAAVSRFVDAVPVWAEVWLPPRRTVLRLAADSLPFAYLCGCACLGVARARRVCAASPLTARTARSGALVPV